MPINPNIILSGNQMAAPQLPDVNAMMQTRTAGMENMYKIERQRQADALAMEDRAVLQQEKTAAAEEKAVIEALLPAYTYGIETGNIAGAFDLVPPEMQANLAPYVQALEGKSPEEVRAALIGSLSASPVGQQALEAMQRAKNAEIQFGQLEVSRANAAREAAREVPVRATPEGVRLGPGEIYNEETGRVEAVKGSQTYNKQKSTQSTDYGAANNALRELEKVKGVVSDLKDTTGFQKAMGTGAVMANLPNVPVGSSISGGYDFQTKYKNLKGSVAALGRTAASLQGKLGNMAVQEWKLVSDAIANLDLESMDADVLDNQLDIIANDILQLEAQVRNAYENEWGDTQFYTPLKGGTAPTEKDDPLGIR